VVGSIVAALYAGRLPTGASGAARDSLGAALGEGPVVAAAAREAFVHAMSRASIVVALVAAAGAVVAWRQLPAPESRGERAYGVPSGPRSSQR